MIHFYIHFFVEIFLFHIYFTKNKIEIKKYEKK